MKRWTSMMTAAMLTLGLIGAGAQAAEYTWDGEAWEDWNTEARWNGRPWENEGDVAHISKGATGDPGDRGAYAPGGDATFEGTLYLHTNGVLRCSNHGSDSMVQDLRLKGGTLRNHVAAALRGNMAVLAPSRIKGGGSSLGSNNGQAVITGSGDLLKPDAGYWNLRVDAGDFTGRWILTGEEGGFWVRGAATTDLGTSQIIIGPDSILNLRQNTSWTLRNDLAGSGQLTLGESTLNHSLTLQGSEIRPGDTADGTGTGIFRVRVGNQTLTLDLNDSEKCRLVIDVTGAGGVAGTDYDQLLALGNGRIALGSETADLTVNFHGRLDLAGQTLTIVKSEDGNDVTGSFETVTLTPSDWRATVNYNADSVTLTDVYRIVRGTVIRIQ